MSDILEGLHSQKRKRVFQILSISFTLVDFALPHGPMGQKNIQAVNVFRAVVRRDPKLERLHEGHLPDALVKSGHMSFVHISFDV